jgi:hypothetical protein
MLQLAAIYLPAASTGVFLANYLNEKVKMT